MVILFGPFEKGLLKVEAFAKCGVVEVDYRNEFVAEAFLNRATCYPQLKVGSGFIKVAYKVEDPFIPLFHAGLPSFAMDKLLLPCGVNTRV